MAKEFLGRGWRFPIFPDAGGRLAYNEAEENVIQSVRVLLLTAVGERVMRGAFGTRAPDLVFSPGSVQYLRLLEGTVRDAILEWEPRVLLDDVNAEADAESEGIRVVVSIAFRIRATNSQFNLVFPYYLGRMERV